MHHWIFLAFCEDVIPSSLLVCANEALDIFAAQHEIAKPGSEASILFAPNVQQRDSIWRDLIDPELCLASRPKVAKSSSSSLLVPLQDTDSDVSDDAEFDWQSADVDVDEHGQVRWLSWINHIDGTQHGAVLSVLAELVRLSLPQLELVSGHRLRSRHIQVVMRAYEQVMDGQGPLYKIAEWHTDGYPREHIIATSVCYLRVDPTLHGGAVDFASGADTWEDDPDALKTVLPQQGAVLAFNNAMLRHRVGALGGAGHRRMVALHLVDPDFCQIPRAMDLPRQLRSQGRLEMLFTLAALSLPNRCKVLIVHFCVDGSLARDLVHRRDLERQHKSAPLCRRNGDCFVFRCCTTIHMDSRLSRPRWGRIGGILGGRS